MNLFCKANCSCKSVSPLLCPTVTDPNALERLQAAEAADVEVRNIRDSAVLSEPIVGVDKVVLDERGQGALSPRMLPAPKEPTPAARAKHNLTHMPYEAWCPCLRQSSPSKFSPPPAGA